MFRIFKLTYFKFLLFITIFLSLGFYISNQKLISRISDKIEREICSPNHEFQNDAPLIEIKINKKQKKKMKKILNHFQKHKKLAKDTELGSQSWKGKLVMNGEEEEAKFKVKGRIAENYADESCFSMKVKTKDSIFSLVPIHLKSYYKEWVINQVLKSEGLPYYKIEFAKVHFFDRDYLVYIIPERPVKDNKIITGLAQYDKSDNFRLMEERGWFDNFNIEFLSLKTEGDFAKYKKNFTRELLKDSIPLKIDEIAKTIALSKLFQGHMPAHGMMLHNVEFYAESSSNKIGFILSDQNFIGVTNADGVSEIIKDKLYSSLFKQKEFCLKFKYYLSHYSRKDEIEKMIKKINFGFEKHMDWINDQFPCYKFSFNDLFHNSTVLEHMVKTNLDTIETKEGSFVVNFGYIPEAINHNDSLYILYPKNDISWRSFLKLD